MNHELQRNIYLGQEGDAWFLRNRSLLGSHRNDSDPVLIELRKAGLLPKEMLEIGCSDGWRIGMLSREYRARAAGIDPSEQAIAEAKSRFADIEFRRGTAEALPFEDGRFDLVVYGFCLCCCDRRDLFRITAEGDRVLKDGGFLVIYDFYVQDSHCRVNHHDSRLVTYKMNHAALFLCNPAYRTVSIQEFNINDAADNPEDYASAVVLMKKDVSAGFPLRITPI